ncbi:hypothetical protein ACIA8O_33995 [Kitasatospora sp. NPDC051853]
MHFTAVAGAGPGGSCC